MAKFAIATCDSIPDLSQDDQLLRNALLESGVEVAICSWDDSGVRWNDFDAVVVRSVWDYHHRHEQFLSWVDGVAASTQMFNSASVLKGNVHKGYLQRFIDLGLSVVPTEWIPMGSTQSVSRVMRQRGWQEVILKPTISASAMQTLKVAASNLAAGEALLAEILPRCDAMVQPCFASVREIGETPMLYFGGQFSHAVRRPSPLDHGEVLIPDQPALATISPTSAQFAVADAVMASLDEVPAYARVDLVNGDDGEPLLLELELVEPYLFMASRPESTAQLASVILASMQN